MRSKRFTINVQPRVWHISIGHGFPVVVQGNGSGSGFDGEYDSLLGVPENVEALAGLTLVGDRLIGTNAIGDMVLLPIPSVPVNTDGLPEGPNNLYYTEARTQGVADSAIANHAGEANPHSQYALVSSVPAAPEDIGAEPAAANLSAIAALVDAGFIIATSTGVYVQRELLLTDIPHGYDYQKLSNRPDISALDELESYEDIDAFPGVGDTNKLYIALDTGLFYRWNGVDDYSQLTGRASIWGQISGLLANQSDLIAELNSRDTANRALSNATGELPQAQITGLTTALAAKAPLSSPALTGTPTAPTPATSDNSTQLATTAMVQAAISDAVTAALQSRELPVGSIYQNDRNATNPTTLLGYGVWESLGPGRVLVGIDPSDTDFDTVGNTGGAKTVTLTTNEIPIHNHPGSTSTAGSHAHTALNNSSHRSSNELGGQGTAAGGSFIDRIMVWIGGNFGTSAAGAHGHTVATNNVGGGQPHDNMPPYQVAYRWVRTA